MFSGFSLCKKGRRVPILYFFSSNNLYMERFKHKSPENFFTFFRSLFKPKVTEQLYWYFILVYLGQTLSPPPFPQSCPQNTTKRHDLPQPQNKTRKETSSKCKSKLRQNFPRDIDLHSNFSKSHISIICH